MELETPRWSWGPWDGAGNPEMEHMNHSFLPEEVFFFPFNSII